MRILGLNKGASCNGKSLADGAIAYFEDDVLRALVMEERITGVLRKGGFDEAYSLLKEKFNVDIDNIDHIGVSTCTESVSNSCIGIGSILESHRSVHAIGHHYSHAYGTFQMSGFDEALIVVIDGGGNVLPNSNNPNNPNWWEEPREQHSYYIANRNEVKLIGRDFDKPYDLGFGELFRAATYLLGFNTSRKAANIMALASYGEYKKVPLNPFIRVIDGVMVSELKYSCCDSYKSFAPLFSNKFNLEPLDLTNKRFTRDRLTKPYWDFCAYIQWNIEQAMLEKLRFLKKATKAAKLCITGGTALNCVMNAKVLESGLFDDVYVPFIPGDHGQSLGNALVVKDMFGQRGNYFFTNTQDAFLGVDNAAELTSEEIELYLTNKDDYMVVVTDKIETYVATLLKNNFVVLTCVGNSEAGYRALGNRSILSNAFNKDALEWRGAVQATKDREWFRPYAPAISSSYFEKISGRKVKSPYMSFAINIEGIAEYFGECISEDKRARIQTVDEKSFIGRVLCELEQIGDTPVCLNTSFNFPGKPIVESMKNALSVFEKTNIDVLATNSCLVCKKNSCELDAIITQLQETYSYKKGAKQCLT
ncbi:MAG: hypothetical protein LBH58_01705 [Tannerellaceae bacterium]|jgi:carbamoyltransferase|nr:hypothetical protein [Tannerellaceae bacterium]